MPGLVCEIEKLRGGADTCPLFCFHYGNFQAVADALEIDQAIYGSRTLGLEEADFDLSVEVLAEKHLERIRSVRAHGPYALLGYSFGGLLAYEVASRLIRKDEAVTLLALFDAPNPDFSRNLSPAERSLVRKKYLADRKAKYLSSLRHGRFDRLAVDIAKLVAKALAPLSLRAGKVVGRFFPRSPPRVSIETRTSAIWHAYSPPPISVPLVLFRSEGRDAEFGDDASMGWMRVVGQGVDVQYARGTHEMMMSASHAATLAARLTPYVVGTAGAVSIPPNPLAIA